MKDDVDLWCIFYRWESIIVRVGKNEITYGLHIQILRWKFHPGL